jgi:hypothetical protein
VRYRNVPRFNRVPFPTLINLEIHGSVAQDTQFEGTVKLETRGHLEVLMRLLNAHLSQAQFSSLVAEELSKENRSLYGDVHYTDISVDNALDTSTPVRAKFDVTGKLLYLNPKTANADQIARALTSIPLAQWHLLSLVPGVDSSRDSSGKFQQLPVDLKGPREYSLHMDLTFASVDEIKPLARKEFHSVKDLAEYESSSGWEGNVFQAAWRLNLRAATIPLSDVREYASFVETVSEFFAGSATKREIARAPGSENSDATSTPPAIAAPAPNNSSKSATAAAGADVILLGKAELLMSGNSNWRMTAAGAFTLGGWWFRVVSTPIFRFLLWRWMWRMFLWTLFLWHVSKINVFLVATHTDMAAGVGFLSEGQKAFSSIVFAGGAVIAGSVGNAIAYEGANFASEKFPMIVCGVLAVTLLIVPLLAVSPALLKIKKKQ